MAINEDKLNELIGQFVTDFGAAMHAATVVIGDKLGLYKALAEHGGRGRSRALRGGVGAGLPGTEYDLVCIFDALHDMGDPVGGARHIRDPLASDGTWLLVEPMAIGGLENNVNPVSRIFYAGAVGICTPAAEAQAGGHALGNQVSDERWGELLGEAGFTRFR